MTLPIVKMIYCQMVGEVDDEMESICGLIEVLFWQLHGGTEEDHKKPQLLVLWPTLKLSPLPKYKSPLLSLHQHPERFVLSLRVIEKYDLHAERQNDGAVHKINLLFSLEQFVLSTTFPCTEVNSVHVSCKNITCI